MAITLVNDETGKTCTCERGQLSAMEKHGWRVATYEEITGQPIEPVETEPEPEPEPEE